MVHHLRSTLSGFAYQFVAIVSGILVTPLILTRLGTESYGAWALLSTIIAYETFADLGLSTAITAYAARSQHDDQFSRIVTTGLTINAALALLLTSGVIALKGLIIGTLFRTNLEIQMAVYNAYDPAMAALFAAVISRGLSSVLDARQRTDLRLGIESLLTVCWSVGVVLAVTNQLGLAGVIWSTTIIGLLRIVLFAAAISVVFPEYRVRFGVPRAVAMGMARYGLNTYAANLGDNLSDPALKGIVGSVLSPLYVGILQLGASVAAIPNGIVYSTIASLFPAMARMHASGESAAAARLAARYWLYVIILIGPLSTFVWAGAEDFVIVWLHINDPAIATSVRLLTLAFLLRALSMVPRRIAWAVGRAQDSTVGMGLHLTTILLGSIILTQLVTPSLPAFLALYIAGYALNCGYLVWRTQYNLPPLFREQGGWLFGGGLRAVGICVIYAAIYDGFARMLTSPLACLAIGAFLLPLTFLMIIFVAVPKEEYLTLRGILIRTVIQTGRPKVLAELGTALAEGKSRKA